MCSHVETCLQCQIPYYYTYRQLYAGCGMTVPHNSLTRCCGRHLRILFDNSRHLVCTTHSSPLTPKKRTSHPLCATGLKNVRLRLHKNTHSVDKLWDNSPLRSKMQENTAYEHNRTTVRKNCENYKICKKNARIFRAIMQKISCNLFSVPL